MRLLVNLALRNAARNVTRTLLTALTVLFGTALLTVALAWAGGIFGQFMGTAADLAGQVRLVQPGYVAREELMPLYENIPDANAAAAEAKKVPGVIAAYPRIATGVTLTVGDEIGDVFGLATGAPLEWFTTRAHLDEDLVSGAFFSGKDENEMLLGAKLASRTGAKVGDDLVIYGQTQDGALSPIKGKIVGIVSAGNAIVDQGVFVTLERMQYLADVDVAATEILVYGEDRNDAPALAAALAADPAFKGLTAQAWSTRDPYAGLLKISNIVQMVLQIIIVFITALGVWNTMMMSVLERTGEIGVLRAMGLSKGGTVLLFVIEALVIAALGGVLGVSVGSLGAFYLEKYGVQLGDQVTQNLGAFAVQTTLYADMNGQIALWAFGLGLCMAFVGSAFPAIRAASIQPVEAMRARR